ncbi:MAG: hypothetical protein B6241_03565 [Spirochaetaceae bacterium 4572_59]|nr:MAG: hypothetical protein B6241_03565 [Spirochaetaceae bacterium 4572_59]
MSLENKWLKGSFDRSSAQILSFGWDSESSGRQNRNLITAEENNSGPHYVGLAGYKTSGEIKTDNFIYDKKSIHYDTKITENIKTSYSYKINNEELIIDILQQVDEDELLMVNDSIRFVWNLQKAITAVIAQPISPEKGFEMGLCHFPALIHAPNYGTLKVELLEGNNETTFLHTDSYRMGNISWMGISPGITAQKGGNLLLHKGDHRIVLRISPIDIIPEKNINHNTFRRSYAGVFAFRPEFYGMSNNSASINCHFVQHVYADMASVVKNSPVNLSQLCQYTAELGIKNGQGYGSNRSQFLDTDPSLIISSIVSSHSINDLEWVEKNWRYISAAGMRMLNERNEDGLLVSQALSGNAGERKWSSNWWDVISFGHLDAFVNAYSYRAFRLLSSAAEKLKKTDESDLFKNAAKKLKENFNPTFFNRETGWLAGWKSRDGKIHDYAFLFINGIAITYGLIEEIEARKILDRLEEKRLEVGYTHFGLGLPGNLIPIRREDYTEGGVLGEPQTEDGSDSFGQYENGGATFSQSFYYLRALGMYNYPVAKEMEEAVMDAFESEKAFSGIGTGVDWKDWSGKANGYEGLLSDQFYVLYAILENRGKAKVLMDWT